MYSSQQTEGETEKPHRNPFGRVWFHRLDADQAGKNALLRSPLAFGDYLVVQYGPVKPSRGIISTIQGSLP